MKGLVVLFIIGAIGCVVTVWIVHHMGTDKGTLIGVAFGNARGDSIEIQWAVPIGMLKVEGPRVDEGRIVTRKDGSMYQVPATVHWDEWVTEHFQLVSVEEEKLLFMTPDYLIFLDFEWEILFQKFAETKQIEIMIPDYIMNLRIIQHIV